VTLTVWLGRRCPRRVGTDWRANGLPAFQPHVSANPQEIQSLTAPRTRFLAWVTALSLPLSLALLWRSPIL
jgi:hypothetical protein